MKVIMEDMYPWREDDGWWPGLWRWGQQEQQVQETGPQEQVQETGPQDQVQQAGPHNQGTRHHLSHTRKAEQIRMVNLSLMGFILTV
jgi:hypothetical protein